MSTDEAAPAEKPASSGNEPPKKIYLVSYPKIVYLYPSFLLALIAGIFTSLTGNADNGTAVEMVCLAFLGVLGLNLVVLSFDFPRTTSLTLFFFFAAAVMGLVLGFQYNPDLMGQISQVIAKMSPFANSQFYFLFAGILAAIFVGVMITVQFDYWEVRPNELLHHHGVLSDLERFAAPNLRIDKEINDVFEYLLLRSGRLILHPSNERRAIVLENVFFINRKEAQLTRMLGAVQVQVRSADHTT